MALRNLTSYYGHEIHRIFFDSVQNNFINSEEEISEIRQQNYPKPQTNANP